MNKYAFLTMDVESFYDTSCVKKAKTPIDERFDCAEDVKKFIDFLNKKNLKATFFVTVDFLPRCKDFLLEAAKSGHEIALHCLHHENIKELSDEEFDKSISLSKEIIKRELGVDIKGIRFPRFLGEKRHIEIIKKHGLIYDSGYVDVSKEKYQKINDLVYEKDGFYEFRLAKSRFLLRKVNISGGGYVRLIPWKTIGKKIDKHIKKSDSYLLYVHPFEIHGGELPKVKRINAFQKMFLVRGREEYLSKIESICEMCKNEEYQFVTMSEYIKNHGKRNED